MGVHASLNQLVLISPEAVAGDGGSGSYTRLSSMDMKWSMAGAFKQYRPTGYKPQTITVLGKEWAQCRASGPLTYDELPYVLSSLLNNKNAGVAIVGKAWHYAPSSTDPDSFQTYGVVWGDLYDATGTTGTGASYTITNAFVNEGRFRFTREEVAFDGQWMGTLVEVGTGALPASTPLPLYPVTPNKVTVGTQAAFGGTVTDQLNIYSAEIMVGNRRSAYWPLNATLPSFGGVVEVVPQMTAEFVVGAETASGDFVGNFTLAAMRAGTPIFMQVHAANVFPGVVDATNVKFDICMEVNEAFEYTDENGVYAIRWRGALVMDPTTQKYIEITVNNTITGL